MAQSTQLPCFTLAEQSRLAVYRAAVAAGFYTDRLVGRSEAYPFTNEEHARMMVYKAAITAGFYTDQIGEDDQEG